MMDMDRIRDEMAQKHDHPGIAMIGEYVTRRLEQGETLAEGKTLAGAFDAIYTYAKAHKTGNYAYVPPEKAYELVDGYFGFGRQAAPETVKVTEPAQPDELDLDKLLWG